MFEPCDPVPILPLTSACDADALDACTDEIISALAQARSPVLLVGVEIRRYGLEQDVALLSRKLGIPVATTFMGKGLLAGQPVDFRGTYMGIAGEQALTELVESSDGLFLLGVLLSDTNFGNLGEKDRPEEDCPGLRRFGVPGVSYLSQHPSVGTGAGPEQQIA